jgi:mannose/fructose/N-acetylgalactosamine-specific phosphotransferase system component IIB
MGNYTDIFESLKYNRDINEWVLDTLGKTSAVDIRNNIAVPAILKGQKYEKLGYKFYVNAAVDFVTKNLKHIIHTYYKKESLVWEEQKYFDMLKKINDALRNDDSTLEFNEIVMNNLIDFKISPKIAEAISLKLEDVFRQSLGYV